MRSGNPLCVLEALRRGGRAALKCKWQGVLISGNGAGVHTCTTGQILAIGALSVL